MTELEISIGGRSFSVACDSEEQEKVRQAAALINEEADSIQTHLGRLPESKMLLLSALMIADRLADLESESTVLKEKSEDLLNLKNKNKQLEQQKSALEVDCQNLEKLAEKSLKWPILGLEIYFVEYSTAPEYSTGPKNVPKKSV